MAPNSAFSRHMDVRVKLNDDVSQNSALLSENIGKDRKQYNPLSKQTKKQLKRKKIL